MIFKVKFYTLLALLLMVGGATMQAQKATTPETILGTIA